MKKKIGITLIVMMICLTTSLYSYSATVDDLENQRNQLDDQKKDAENELAGVKQEKSQTLSEIEELSDKISDSETQLAKLNDEIKALETEIAENQKELEEAEKRYKEQQEALETRIVAQYKVGKTSYLDVLLKSKSLSSFISSYYLVGKIAKYDEKLLNDIEEEQQKIEKTKAQLEEKNASIKSAKSEQQKTNTVLKNAQVQKNSKVAKLSAEEKAIQDKIEEYNAAIQQSEAKIQQAIEAVKNSNTSNTGSGGGANKPLTGGTLEWPLPASYATYSRITSYFGPRKQPTAGASTNHGAIDIGVPLGTSVYSAEIGTVITAQWYGGYGNFIMIKHDNGLVTAYGHLSSIRVNVGQRVSRGQVIALSGSTGISTGPHLHFEVRLNPYKNYNRVDPLNYLTL